MRLVLGVVQVRPRPTRWDGASCWSGVDILSRPLPAHATEVVIRAGEALVIPEHYWHAAENLEATIAVGMNTIDAYSEVPAALEEEEGDEEGDEEEGSGEADGIFKARWREVVAAVSYSVITRFVRPLVRVAERLTVTLRTSEPLSIALV